MGPVSTKRKSITNLAGNVPVISLSFRGFRFLVALLWNMNTAHSDLSILIVNNYSHTAATVAINGHTSGSVTL